MPFVSKTNSTHLCIHKKFANQNPSYAIYASKNSKAEESQSSIPSNSAVFVVKNPEILHIDEDAVKILTSNGSGVSYHYGLIREKMFEMLEAAKNNVVAVHDVQVAVGIENDPKARRWLNNQLISLSNEGFVEVVTGISEASSKVRSIRLLKPYEKVKETSTQKYMSKIQNESEEFSVLGDGGVVAEYSLEWQIFRVICLAGVKGATMSV